ncbi:hypothetical protein ABDK00_015505 [Niabella insulamsoli]|uniref:hypothetical protein n=1 Tax=Niabella insulamsoli TaxID=3144874 RepID=UPI0031FBB3C1
MPFENNVFINCPFDDDFMELLRPLLFCLVYFDFEPKIAQTESSANIRINQIKQHIRNSKFSIHDLSRSKPLKKNDLPRFNMPYELGLDIGCAEFGLKKYSFKKILILEAERYHYQKVLSDIAGQDIENHENDPSTLIRKVRNWFSTAVPEKDFPSGHRVWIAYNQFYDDITNTLLAKGFTIWEIENMPTSDFIRFSKRWIIDFTS